jgi:hypothetical protein
VLDEPSPVAGDAEQVVLTLPIVVVLTPIEKLQSAMSETSMNCPSQNRPPCALPQLVVHDPWRVSLQLTSHVMFACTVHEPLQHSPHSVVQLVEPGVSWQDWVHCAPQLDEHSELQSLPVQADMQPASQSEVQ